MDKRKQIRRIKQDYLEGKHLNLVGFWGDYKDTPEESTLSNFQWATFVYDVGNDIDTGKGVGKKNNITFTSSEQFFIYKKAIHFKDYGIVEKVLESGHQPDHYKQLGREVSNYDDKEWERVRYGYMLEALRLKYGQNEDLLGVLLSTGEAILVETSPNDVVWGVGLAKETNNNNNKIQDWENPLKWRGDNLLGFALMQVRDENK